MRFQPANSSSPPQVLLHAEELKASRVRADALIHGQHNLILEAHLSHYGIHRQQLDSWISVKRGPPPERLVSGSLPGGVMGVASPEREQQYPEREPSVHGQVAKQPQKAMQPIRGAFCIALQGWVPARPCTQGSRPGPCCATLQGWSHGCSLIQGGGGEASWISGSSRQVSSPETAAQQCLGPRECRFFLRFPVHAWDTLLSAGRIPGFSGKTTPWARWFAGTIESMLDAGGKLPCPTFIRPVL